ncbi:MAG: hypothetical protein LQ338_000414 [Usnochroma carphineum]|nr:MAG: hypothetical protein LQ338_000414 [Usnochroma carphineum]
MTTRTYNEYLDAGHSEDDASSIHDSDDLQEAKGKNTGSKTSTKRRKTNHKSSDEESDDGIGSVHGADPTTNHNAIESPTKAAPAEEPVRRSNSPPPPSELPHGEHPTSTTASKPSRSRKPGVIYLSRIPPFMRPSTVRHLLSPFGPIIKLFLTPEPSSQHTSRVRSGGNKKRSFIDGWIEFSDHKHAKTCVAAINGQTMGGRGWYRDDVWNAKYLRGFGWEDLMAGVRGEEREREERVRVGVRRERREREEFLKGVERGRMEQGKKRKREAKRREGEDAGFDEHKEGNGQVGRFERRFRQNEVKRKREVEEQPEGVTRVLSKIF